jgi:hypothetical protein
MLSRWSFAAVVGLSLAGVACASETSSESSEESPIVIEHSADDLRKAILVRSTASSGGPGDAILYCELPISASANDCAPEQSLAMAYPTYQAKLGDEFDRLFPDFARDVQQLTAKRKDLQGRVDAVMTKQDVVRGQISTRSSELAATIAPLQAQRAGLESARGEIQARNAFLDGEMTRIRSRLDAPDLDPNDRPVLEGKLAALKSEETTNVDQIASDTAQMADLDSRIDTIVNHDTAMGQLTAQLDLLVRQGEDLGSQLTQTIADLGAAVSRRDAKVGGALDLVTKPDFKITDFGDSASRLVFNPFRAPGTTFATSDSCVLKVVEFNPSAHGAMGWILYRVTVDRTAIFPARGNLPPGAAFDPTKVDLAEPRQVNALMHFDDEGFPGLFHLSGNWPDVKSVAAPTGTLACTRTGL